MNTLAEIHTPILIFSDLQRFSSYGRRRWLGPFTLQERKGWRVTRVSQGIKVRIQVILGDAEPFLVGFAVSLDVMPFQNRV